MQLMDNYCPYAAGLLMFLVPTFEPIGISTPLSKPPAGSLLGYKYTPLIVAAIALTAVLGLLVSLSTFLVIGATSTLTYNVVSSIAVECMFCLHAPVETQAGGQAEPAPAVTFPCFKNLSMCTAS